MGSGEGMAGIIDQIVERKKDVCIWAVQHGWSSSDDGEFYEHPKYGLLHWTQVSRFMDHGDGEKMASENVEVRKNAGGLPYLDWKEEAEKLCREHGEYFNSVMSRWVDMLRDTYKEAMYHGIGHGVEIGMKIGGTKCE
jgi:hypothetical protein